MTSRLITREQFSAAFYDEMTSTTPNSKNLLRQFLTEAGSAPVSANLLEAVSVKAALLQARKPGQPVNYPTKGDYTIYFNPSTMLAGEARQTFAGGRGALFLAPYPMLAAFQPAFQTNKPANSEIELPDPSLSAGVSRILVKSPGYWLVHFNFNLGFRPTTKASAGAPRLANGLMHGLMTASFNIRTPADGNVINYSPLFTQRILRQSFLNGTNTPFSGSFVVQLDSASLLVPRLRRSPTVGYYSTDDSNPEKLGFIKTTPQTALQDPTEDIGNFIRLTRLA